MTELRREKPTLKTQKELLQEIRLRQYKKMHKLGIIDDALTHAGLDPQTLHTAQVARTTVEWNGKPTEQTVVRIATREPYEESQTFDIPAARKIGVLEVGADEFTLEQSNAVVRMAQGLDRARNGDPLSHGRAPLPDLDHSLEGIRDPATTTSAA